MDDVNIGREKDKDVTTRKDIIWRFLRYAEENAAVASADPKSAPSIQDIAKTIGTTPEQLKKIVDVMEGVGVFPEKMWWQRCEGALSTPTTSSSSQSKRPRTMCGLILHSLELAESCENLEKELEEAMADPKSHVLFEDIRATPSYLGRNVLVISHMPPKASWTTSFTPTDALPYAFTLTTSGTPAISIVAMMPKSLGELPLHPVPTIPPTPPPSARQSPVSGMISPPMTIQGRAKSAPLSTTILRNGEM